MAHIHTHSYKIIFISLFCLLRSAISLSPYPKVENNLPALGNWLSHGGDIYNRRYAEGESKISPWTASRLRLKWRFNAGNDITATPAVCDGIVYFPSWNGYIYAVRAADGSLVWRKNLQHLTALNSTLFTSNSTAPVARATPAVADDKLIIGISGPAYVIAVKRATGDLVWKTQLDDHYASLITMSGTYYNSYPLNDPAETVGEIGSSIRKVMGGTSGIIYDIFCKAAYAQLKANSHAGITALQWAGALEAAIAAVSKYGGAKAGYRTLLDALIPASSVLKEKLASGEDPIEAFVLSAEAAVAGAESTKNMQAHAGRSSYVSAEILASVPDPGAMAAASWYRAAALAVKNKSKGGL